MQSKSFLILALSVSAVMATPHQMHPVLHLRGSSSGHGQAANGLRARQAWQVGNSRVWGGDSNSAVESAPAAVNTMPAPSVGVAGSNSPSTSGSASGPASTGSSSAPATSGGKKGIAYNTASLVSAFTGMSWTYNWGAGPDGNPGVEFVPMLWAPNRMGQWSSAVSSAISSGSKAVLSFNEPDLGAQANVDPQTAASKHKEAMSGLKGQVAIGSPAVTNGGSTSPPMGVNWLDAFFQSCGSAPECPVDFVAYHWYGDADNIADFKRHTQAVIDLASKYGISKVWCTEFAPSGSVDAQASFMTEAVSYLEGTAAVERYSAFMASEGTLLSGGALNAAGKAYVG